MEQETNGFSALALLSLQCTCWRLGALGRGPAVWVDEALWMGGRGGRMSARLDHLESAFKPSLRASQGTT